MGKIFKWIGGGLGFAYGGIIGGLLGFAVGSVIDSMNDIQIQRSDQRVTPGDYVLSLLVLIAAVMKADGRVVRAELNYVKHYFLQRFDEESATEAIKLLRDILNQPIPLADVCRQIAANMRYAERLEIIHFLFGVASADGGVAGPEHRVIETIASNLGISRADYTSIESMFIQKNIKDVYKILEVAPDAGNEEIKKAYRKMALKYHPDKVEHLGEDFQRIAKEKFQKIQYAYEKIKESRGMK